MKRRESLGLDLTPVIDVVFILLIFFIVTSVFKKDIIEDTARLCIFKITNETTTESTMQ